MDLDNFVMLGNIEDIIKKNQEATSFLDIWLLKMLLCF